MMRVSAVLTVGVLLTGASGAPLHGQEPWKASNYPYLLSNENDGVQLVFRYELSKAADYFDRHPRAGIFSVEGGISDRGSRFARARFFAPLLTPGWRFDGEAYATREARFGFFDQEGGLLPPGPVPDPDIRDRVRRTRYGFRSEVTRRIVGPLQVAVSGTVEQVRFTDVSGPSVFENVVPSGEVEQTDVRGRLALVLDARDNEFVTAKGLFVEGGVYTGTGADGYHGGYGIIKGFVSPREGTVIAARVAGRSLGGGPTLDAQYTIPAWENPITALGGVESHRSFVRGRFRGSNVLFGGLDLRHDLLNAGDFGAVTLLGFVDAGRVFRDDFDLTLDDMEVGGGGGLALRILRSALFVFNFAGGPDGLTFTLGTGWSF